MPAKIAFFDTHPFEKEAFEKANSDQSTQITFLDTRLDPHTASLAKGHDAVCVFVEDKVTPEVLGELKKAEVKWILLRSAGYNHVDLKEAKRLGFKLARVPEYSPYAIAEHAAGLLLTLNRKIHRAYHRVRELNFSLDGLVGFDLHQKTVGVVGTGKIGTVFANIMKGFGCQVICHDLKPNPELEALGIPYSDLKSLFQKSDIISLHVPLTPETHHLINQDSIQEMKEGVFLINTGRGALIETQALIQGLKSKKIGGAGLDVYEEEEGVFFHDLSGDFLEDDLLARLLTFPNVLITSHQAFLTKEALRGIAETTLLNFKNFQEGVSSENNL